MLDTSTATSKIEPFVNDNYDEDNGNDCMMLLMITVLSRGEFRVRQIRQATKVKTLTN